MKKRWHCQIINNWFYWLWTWDFFNNGQINSREFARQVREEAERKLVEIDEKTLEEWTEEVRKNYKFKKIWIRWSENSKKKFQETIKREQKLRAREDREFDVYSYRLTKEGKVRERKIVGEKPKYLGVVFNDIRDKKGLEKLSQRVGEKKRGQRRIKS